MTSLWGGVSCALDTVDGRMSTGDSENAGWSPACLRNCTVARQEIHGYNCRLVTDAHLEAKDRVRQEKLKLEKDVRMSTTLLA